MQNMTETISYPKENFELRKKDTFSERDTFKKYHYYAEYDPNRKYRTTPFEYNYGYGNHIYLYEIYSIVLTRDKEIVDTKKYIVAIPQDNLLSETTHVHYMDSFNEKDTFKEYHYYEEYDPNKLYHNMLFDYDYGHGIHTYRYELYTIGLEKYKEKKKYIIVTEQLSEEEINILKPYCRCKYCTAGWCDLSIYFKCEHCIGCLKSKMPRQYQIDKARKYMMKI